MTSALYAVLGVVPLIRSWSKLLALLLAAVGLHAQVALTGRVVDENGAGIGGVRVEFRSVRQSAPLIASSDVAGNFQLILPEAGEYKVRAERLGFFVYQGPGQQFDPEPHQLTITLNHLQEFADSVDVVYSPPAIDLQQPADRKELNNTEIESVPYPAPQDYRNALPMMDGVVQDNLGRVHFNGGDTNQTSYALDGFNIADPVTGRLDTRLNIDSIQTMELDSSRFSAENGRGSTGALDLRTKMGDDRFRFAGTNFIPGISTEGGFHFNHWTPRFEISGPIAKGRAWFHNGFDAYYYVDTISGLPSGQNRTTGLTLSDLSRFQVNLTHANSLTGSFLYNLADTSRYGLSILNPVETTTNLRQATYMSTLRDQHYFSNGALVEGGFADSRILLRNPSLGNQLYEITPFGNRGNYFANMNRHTYRQQGVANLFLPSLHGGGTHRFKFGVDFEREAFHQETLRHDYQVLRADDSVARYVTFLGAPFEARKNFEAAQYVQDQWTVREGLSLDMGVRMEWNEIVRDLETAPRVAVAWAPRGLADTKISAGWGVYYDAISLGTIALAQDQTSLSTFFLPGGIVNGPVSTSFQVTDRTLKVPYHQVASVSIDRKLLFDFYAHAGYTWRYGPRGFVFTSSAPETGPAVFDGAVYQLVNRRHDRYDAFDFTLRRTFRGQFEWFAGYTRSSARTNAAVDYSIENPIFAPQMPGPFSWDTPNRFHMWGWVPLPKRFLPPRWQWITRNTTAAYLLEYRTGFPFNVVSEDGFLVGRPDSTRYPDYFNINLHFERKFRALHYLWAWRCGFNNITGSLNANVVNNVQGTPQFLTYGRGQARAFSVRLRLLGRK